jgi:hypothetical protein
MNKTQRANHNLMRAAGFKRDYQSGTDFWIWTRGDIKVAVGSQKLTLKKLVGHVIAQAAYRMRRSASIQFTGFKTDNAIATTKGDS